MLSKLQGPWDNFPIWEFFLRREFKIQTQDNVFQPPKTFLWWAIPPSVFFLSADAQFLPLLFLAQCRSLLSCNCSLFVCINAGNVGKILTTTNRFFNGCKTFSEGLRFQPICRGRWIRQYFFMMIVLCCSGGNPSSIHHRCLKPEGPM